jgi:hypothetical protein
MTGGQSKRNRIRIRGELVWLRRSKVCGDNRDKPKMACIDVSFLIPIR